MNARAWMDRTSFHGNLNYEKGVPVVDESANSEKRDAILELERSKGWGLVMQRIDEELERQRKALEAQNTDVWQTEGLRGSIKALRMVLSIPGILKEEFAKEE
jgi:hypothetical protein